LTGCHMHGPTQYIPPFSLSQDMLTV
jgi:hypothetical protein